MIANPNLMRNIFPPETENTIIKNSFTYWMTGLSASGKSTLARNVQNELKTKGILIAWLDGDQIRSGLNNDLDFSQDDRTENLRRVAEVCKLFNLNGISVISSFISPLDEQRQMAQAIIGSERFKEIHISTPLKVCETRDPKKLYKKAYKGEIPNFTGVSSRFEVPQKPFLNIDTSTCSIIEATNLVLESFMQLTKEEK